MTNPSPKSVFGPPLKSAVMTSTRAGGSIRQFFGEHPENYAFLGLKGHNGLDIATFRGDDVLAVADGVVFNTATVGDALKEALTRFNGNAVWLLTDPCSDGKAHLVVYGHLDSVCVIPKQIVKRGQKLGTQGNTGYVTNDVSAFWGNAPANEGVHTHFSHYDLSEGDDGYGSYQSGGKRWHITNPNNGYKGATDPYPLFLDEAKNKEISGLQKVVEFLRSILKSKGIKPVA